MRLPLCLQSLCFSFLFKGQLSNSHMAVHSSSVYVCVSSFRNTGFFLCFISDVGKRCRVPSQGRLS